MSPDSHSPDASQPAATPDPSTVELVARVLDDEASLEDINALNHALPKDPALLSYFVEMRLLHGALEEELGSQSVEMAALSDRVISLQQAGQLQGHGAVAARSAPTQWRKLAMVAALSLIASLGAFWGVSKLLYRPAFEVVARYSTGDQVPERGQWVKTRQSIKLGGGVVELRSADGNSFTFQGPGELKIHDASELTLHSGKLWADLSGQPILIHAPRGQVTDLGTIFGLDASKAEFTRVDVFDGKVRFAHRSNPAGVEAAGEGESLTSQGEVWSPERGVADASRYMTGLREPMGFSFVGSEDEGIRIRASMAHGARWSTAHSPSGSLKIAGTTVEIAWAGSSFYSVGDKGSPNERVYYTHLLGKPWTKGEHHGRIAEAKALALPHENVGIAIQLRHLDAWRASIGAKALRVMVLRNSANEQVKFYPIKAYDVESGELLATLKADPRDYRPGGTSHADGSKVTRVLKRFEQNFTADSLNLVVEAVREENGRANISGLILEPVY